MASEGPMYGSLLIVRITQRIFTALCSTSILRYIAGVPAYSQIILTALLLKGPLVYHGVQYTIVKASAPDKLPTRYCSAAGFTACS
jgi:hypothetical protein